MRGIVDTAPRMWALRGRPPFANVLFARSGPPRELAASILAAFPRYRAALARIDPLSAQ
jgi:hypothetical protein